MEKWRKRVLLCFAILLVLLGCVSGFFPQSAQLTLGIIAAVIWLSIIVIAVGDELFSNHTASGHTIQNVLNVLSAFEKHAEDLGSCRYENSYYKIEWDTGGRKYIDTSECARYLDEQNGVFHDFHGNNTYDDQGRKMD